MSNRGSVAEETDSDLLAKQAYEEMDAEKEGREPKNFLEEKKEDSPEDTPKPEEEGEDQDKDIDDSEGQKTGDEEDKPEEESDEKPETEGDEEEEEGKEGEGDDLDAQITQHAEKHSMTYAEAKEDIEKTNKIIEQFKNDPKEMARALRNKDREYDKLKNEIDKKENAEPVFQRMTEDQFRIVAKDKIEEDPEKYLEAYKKRYPAKSEMMSDEAIIEEIVEREWTGYQQFAGKKEGELKEQAAKKRDEFINSFSEEDRKFLPEVKAMLYELKDRDILDPDWQPDYLIHLAKGKRYDQDIEEARKQEAKRIKEDPKILGVKGGQQGPSSSKKGSSGGGLSAAQINRALEMFPMEDGYDQEKACSMFKEVFAKELKENPSFVS